MDYISPSTHPASPSLAQVPLTIESGRYCEPAGPTACAVFAPMHYEPGYAYPLVVWLHGPGAGERQLLRVMPLVSMRNYVAVAPRGTWHDAEDACGYDWRQTERHIALAEHRVFDAIDTARAKYHVHSGRVFLAGFDSGGTMALRVALAHPSRFAGVASLGGPLPTGGNPLGNFAEVRRLPVLLAAGNQSPTFHPELVGDNERLLHTAGVPIAVRRYSCGQELSPQMLADVDRWIIEQIANSRPGRARRDAD